MTKTLADYADALERRPIPDFWLVRNADGLQTCTHADTPDGSGTRGAIAHAEKIGGTVEWYHPIQSTYWDGTKRYDH